MTPVDQYIAFTSHNVVVVFMDRGQLKQPLCFLKRCVVQPQGGSGDLG